MLCMKQSITYTSSEKISRTSLAQRERLAYIEFRLFFLGDIRRQDLMERFSIAPAAATRPYSAQIVHRAFSRFRDAAIYRPIWQP